MKKIIFILVLSLSFGQLKAALINSTSTGGNWSNPTTWVGGILPGPADAVRIVGGATVVLDVNATVNTVSFTAAYPAEGLLLINDALTPRILTIAAGLDISAAASNGRVLVSGAEHEIHTANLFINNAIAASQIIHIDMPVGKIVMEAPAVGNTNMQCVANGTMKVKRLEYGNGVATIPGLFTSDFLMYPNGRAVVMNNATVHGSSISYGGEPTASLVIKNGGTFIGSLGSTTALNNLNLGEIESEIINGTFLVRTNLFRVTSIVAYYLPTGTFGNLSILEYLEGGNLPIINKSGPKSFRINGSGVRSARIIGNFELKRAVTNFAPTGNNQHGDYFFEGGLNVSDCPNVTWDFAGSNTQINLGRDGIMMFKSVFAGTNSTLQPTVKISGTVRINHFVNVPEASATAYKSNIEIYNLDIPLGGDLRYGSGAVVAMPNGATPEHHRMVILGNMNIDGQMNLTNTVRNILYFNNQAAATYSGSGVLHVSKLLGRINGTAANATKITSTLNEIFLEPNEAFIYNATANPSTIHPLAGDYTWFEATAGTFRLDNKDYSTAPLNYGALDKMYIYTGIGATHRVAFHDITVEDSTILIVSNLFGNSATNFMKINGDINMAGPFSKINHSGSSLATNVIEFNGSSKQFINAFDEFSLNLNRIKINNAAGVECKEDLKLTMINNPSLNTPQLQLVLGVLKMGPNADKQVWIDNIGASYTTGLTSGINDGVLPVNVNDYSDSWVHGKIRMIVKANAAGHNGATGPNSFEFPVGTATHPQVARIATNTSIDYWMTVSFNENPTIQPNPTNCFVNENSTGPNYGAMSSLINNGYWTITPHTPFVTGNQHNVTLISRGYTNGGAASPGTTYGLVNRLDSTSPWVGAGNTNTNTPQNTGVHLNAEQTEQGGAVIFTRRNNVTFYGDFAAASTILSTPLPIQWISFEAENSDHGNILHWVTTAEKNTTHYEIEKSSNATQWTKIESVIAQGHFSEENHYEFVDQNYFVGMNYYRIKQYDVDGQYSYSEIRTVFNQPLEQTITIYPNPSTMNLNIIIPNQQGAKIEVFSMDGKLQLTQKTLKQNYSLDISGLATGSYIIRIQNAKHTCQHSFIKQ